MRPKNHFTPYMQRERERERGREITNKEKKIRPFTDQTGTSKRIQQRERERNGDLEREKKNVGVR